MAVNFNEENIKDAINNGIDAEAINSTLDDMVSVSFETGKTPKQMKEVVGRTRSLGGCCRSISGCCAWTRSTSKR